MKRSTFITTFLRGTECFDDDSKGSPQIFVDRNITNRSIFILRSQLDISEGPDHQRGIRAPNELEKRLRESNK
uniref:Uncharacterized protein n=1 Tax=Heterorhabditis bacteriophora TaxID=37862 RepID=A0A1I7XA03_HETBA